MPEIAGTGLVAGGEPPISLLDVFHRRQGQFSDYPKSQDDYYKYYTFGPYYSLKVIITELGCRNNEYVLVPSYLCPSILLPFQEASVRYKFYNIRYGFLPDQNDIMPHIGNGLKAVLFIDYFGYPQKAFMQPVLSILKNQGVTLIQDAVQSWINNEDNLYGDFCFNSLRKYAPYEGSVLLSKRKLSLRYTNTRLLRFLCHKRYSQVLRYCHLKYGWFKPDTFLKHIEISNQSYHREGIAKLPKMNKHMLNKIDFDGRGKDRKLVVKAILDSGLIEPLIDISDSSAVPLGLPIYTKNRDMLRLELIRRNIFCPIHWLLSSEIDRDSFRTSWDIQDHELTLPVNIDPGLINLYLERLQEVFL